MMKISFSPEAWAVRTAGFPRIVQSVLFDVSLHNWRTGTAMSLAHFRIVTGDLGEEQAMGIADMLLGAGKIEQGDDGSIWSPEAIEEFQVADTLRQQRSRGGSATSGVLKPRAKPQPKPAPKAKPVATKKPAVQPVAPVKPAVQPEPPAGEDEAAAAKVAAAQDARRQLEENVRRLGEAWNVMALAAGLSQIEKMTDERKKSAAARIKEHGIDRLLEKVALIPQSEFLLGVNKNKWKANFDWLVQASSCTKLVEGFYHNTGEGNEKPSGWR